MWECLHVCCILYVIIELGCGSGGERGEAKKWSSYKEVQVRTLSLSLSPSLAAFLLLGNINLPHFMLSKKLKIVLVFYTVIEILTNGSSTRYLENSGCVGMCVNMCKIPTQDFFNNEFGLPLTMTPSKCWWINIVAVKFKVSTIFGCIVICSHSQILKIWAAKWCMDKSHLHLKRIQHPNSPVLQIFVSLVLYYLVNAWPLPCSLTIIIICRLHFESQLQYLS